MQRQPIIHSIKITCPHFKYIKEGERDFAVCFDDRDYHIGDLLIFQEQHYKVPGGKMTPTGEQFERKIKHILRKFRGLMNGYVILGLEEGRKGEK